MNSYTERVKVALEAHDKAWKAAGNALAELKGIYGEMMPKARLTPISSGGDFRGIPPEDRLFHDQVTLKQNAGSALLIIAEGADAVDEVLKGLPDSQREVFIPGPETDYFRNPLSALPHPR